jgi:hypothetical protein
MDLDTSTWYKKGGVGKYGLSNCCFSDLEGRGLGTGGMGESKGDSTIVSAGDGRFGDELEAITLPTVKLLRGALQWKKALFRKVDV